MSKAILFDIDGTLLDAWDFIVGALRYSLSVYGYPQPSKKEIKKALGKSLIDFYQAVIPIADPLTLAASHHQFQKKNFHLIKPFPKTKKTLKALKKSGFLLAAVSNRMRESLVGSLIFTGIFDYFDVVVCADDVKNPKPHPEHLLFAMEKLEAEPINSYMVGDSPQDIIAGKGAKVKTIGVTYGMVGKGIIKHSPDYAIDDIEEILKILKDVKI